MLIIEDAWNEADLTDGAVCTIGNYDGVHRGQRRVLDRVTSRAAETGLLSAVVTFEPHPRRVLTADGEPRSLTTGQQKRRLLAACGVDVLAILRFTEEFSRVAAEAFVGQFLIGRLGAQEVIVGSSFAFGRGRHGDLALLERLSSALGFRVEGVDELLHEGSPVSSTRVRRAVVEGSVEEACELLGRAFSLTGEVVAGDGRGRELGWPTANLRVDNEVLPAVGVYATAIRFEGAEVEMPSVSNVGVRPTVEERSEVVVETHVLDLEDDLYGRRCELFFCRRLRDERRFGSLEELKDQIGRDAEGAREYFRSESCCRMGTEVVSPT